MSFQVLADSRAVVLPARVLHAPELGTPRLHGLVVAASRVSGLPAPFFIERMLEGLPKGIVGDTWRYAWRPDGEKHWALWIGFPDVLFTTSIDSIQRLAVEVLGFRSAEPGPIVLARIEVSLRPRRHAKLLPNEASWLPDSKPPRFPLV
jgi:hypothetical protein